MEKQDAVWFSYSLVSTVRNSNTRPCIYRSRSKPREISTMTEPALVAHINRDLLLNYYKKMLELRLFELKVQELYRNGRLPGFVHLYVGEEAVAVGVCSNLEAGDLVFSTHRGHGH